MSKKNMLRIVLYGNLCFCFCRICSQSPLPMENCGAYLFEWRPVDCGNGNSFAILVGGNTIAESNVILNADTTMPIPLIP